MSFSKFEEFSAIKSLNSLAAPFSLSLSIRDSYGAHTGSLYGVHRSLRFCLLFFDFFLFLSFNNFHCSLL